ncbi:MAG: zf-TFIIB domain-containing protein [Sulfurovaceae bacterium]|nr:zf-TFIIB domain-containing protein [Sulfurovaceae bacterium]
MKCPVCITESLVISERSGIEIDYCPKCRGIWLDRGELDKIIERAEKQTSTRPLYNEERGPRYDHHDRNEYSHHQKHYKKKSFWGELFD